MRLKIDVGCGMKLQREDQDIICLVGGIRDMTTIFSQFKSHFEGYSPNGSTETKITLRVLDFSKPQSERRSICKGKLETKIFSKIIEEIVD